MNTNIYKYLPNRIVIAFVIIPALAFMSFFVIKSFMKEDIQVSENGKTKFIATLKEEVEQKDTDGDGLLDWQENLYKTDIHKKDTDGDGISDGDEAARGTNPTDPFNKTASNKKNLTDKTDSEESTSYRDDKTLTKTDVVARDFFVKLMELKESNLSYNKNAQRQVVKELMNENKIVLTDKYKIDDLKIVEDIKIGYFHKILKDVSENYDSNSFQDERILFAKFLESKDTKYLDIIKKQVEQYQKLEGELLGLEVPSSVGVLYLEYLNSFSLYIKMTNSLIDFKDDPVLVSSMILLYNKIEKRMDESAKALSYFFEINT